MLGVTDEYTAYCLDEACAYAQNRLANGATLLSDATDNRPVSERMDELPHYDNPLEFFEALGVG